MQQRISRPWRRLHRQLGSSPGRLRLLSAALITLTLLTGLAGLAAFRTAAGAVSRAQANTDQLVRVQTIRINFVTADAETTNGFLIGGLEPVAQRLASDRAVREAASLIPQASAAQSADTQALARLNVTLSRYLHLVQESRTQNRQLNPIAAQYLKESSALIRLQALPQLNQLTRANESRAEQEFRLVHTAPRWLLVSYPVSLAVLIWAQVWLARRSRRYVNLPLVGSTVVLLIGFIGLYGYLAFADHRVGEIRRTSYAATKALSDARANASDARANEGLTLVARGAGDDFEASWAQNAPAVTQALQRANSAGADVSRAAEQWPRYGEAHQKIRLQDGKGEWEQAVAEVTAIDSPSRAAFRLFEESVQTSLATARRQVRTALGSAQGHLAQVQWLALSLGPLAAALAWWGCAQRLEDYR
ncbi:MAG: hypothetical protein ACRC0L_06070 [Angustibacter sp.]